MRRLMFRCRHSAVLLALMAFGQIVPPDVLGQSAVRLNNFQGAVDVDAPGPVVPFTMAGTASHLGKFECYGEVEFAPSPDGSQLGAGVAVFTAANGDLLVGLVTWEIAAGGDFRGARLAFHWRDSVQFDNGTVVYSTGRFAHDRPPGLVVIAIIAILIGLLLPAVHAA
jgi:hypothetical protein